MARRRDRAGSDNQSRGAFGRPFFVRRQLGLSGRAHVTHTQGHIIPADRARVEPVRQFLLLQQRQRDPLGQPAAG
jgi:hypothetical protein